MKSSRLKYSCFLCFLCFFNLLSAQPGVPPEKPAQEKALCTQILKVKLDELGNAQILLKVEFHPLLYKNVIDSKMTGLELLRRLNLLLDWYEPENFQQTQEDTTCTILITFTIPGFAHPLKNNAWQILFRTDETPIKVEINKEDALISLAVNTDFGLSLRLFILIFPSGSNNIQMLRNPNQFIFEMPRPSSVKNSPAQGEMQWEAKPYIITCIAKSYGYEKFDILWLARSRFKNTGGEPIQEYQVRFRVADFSTTWNPWNIYPQVLPGQLIVTPFFPLLDIEKINKLEGRRQTLIEMEYEYKLADGQILRKNDSAKIELLGKNEVVFSTLPSAQLLKQNFYNHTNIAWLVLSSFTTKDDPVIQQLAGMVSSMAQENRSASMYEKDALEFMKNLFIFMNYNKIAYQTPPGEIFDSRSLQHVKYGRDVLQNRAGTCVDLAILYASVCEAVGLDAVLVLIDGHCFPAVQAPPPLLPDGTRGTERTLFGIEATLIASTDNFELGKKAGMENLKILDETHAPQRRIQIQTQRANGVHSMELKAVSEDWIYKLGYVIPLISNPIPSPIPVPIQSLVGVWTASFNNNTLEAEYTSNGMMNGSVKNSYNQIVLQGSVSYIYQNGICKLTGNGFYEEAQITWIDANHFNYKILKNPNNLNVLGLEFSYSRK